MMIEKEKSKTDEGREVETLKLVASCWLFSVPVTKHYPDYKLAQKIKEDVEQFVETLGCSFREYGTGTGPNSQQIVAFRVRIELANAEEKVQKIKDFLAEKVMPIIWCGAIAHELGLELVEILVPAPVFL